ncbi:uncharacterized protein LOC121860196 [Homarus americanus]|uniref:uncharacterized protein LOC121860196 n=1 Tax=Homarus americanus TaxID=6706 RepID=UPI001C481646|nr:uncharacterized protein LOC121860196 [Homarus americanus]
MTIDCEPGLTNGCYVDVIPSQLFFHKGISSFRRLICASIQKGPDIPFSNRKQDLTSSVLGVIEAVLASVACSNYSVFFLTDGTTSASTVYNLQGHLQVPRGIGVFEVASDGQDNVTIKIQFAHVMNVINQLRELSSHTVIVVISNDPAFLAAFNEWFLKTRLLVWSTRLLVVTRLPLPKLLHLQRTFSKMNAMLVISSDNDLGNISMFPY